MSKSGSRRLVLLGGPTGVGKTSVLRSLAGSVSKCGVLDADDVWRVDPHIAVSGNRNFAIQNTLAVVRGYFEAGCEVVVLGWVFARPTLFRSITDSMEEDGIAVTRLYLIADEKSLEQRLSCRDDLDRLEYSFSRLRLIEKLPYPKIDTSDLSTAEVVVRVKVYSMKKTILQGFLFGIGFSIAVLLCMTLYGFLLSNFVFYESSWGGTNLSDLTMEEKIAESDIILRTVHSRGKSHIAEFVKRENFVDFDYKIGDEYYPFGEPDESRSLAGDGTIVFLNGNPPSPKFSTSYAQYRLSSYNNDVLNYLLEEHPP